MEDPKKYVYKYQKRQTNIFNSPVNQLNNQTQDLDNIYTDKNHSKCYRNTIYQKFKISYLDIIFKIVIHFFYKLIKICGLSLKINNPHFFTAISIPFRSFGLCHVSLSWNCCKESPHLIISQRFMSSDIWTQPSFLARASSKALFLD